MDECFFLLTCILVIAIFYLRYIRRRFPRRAFISKRYSPLSEPTRPEKPNKSHKKPQWVKDEILLIRAFQPQASCRQIAQIFNDRYAEKETVGKTYVSYTIKRHLYEIQVLRKKIKNRPPHRIPFNKTWGMDLTFIHQQPVLGIIEHHSRKCLGLVSLKQKSSVAILKALISVLERHPKPQQIRTDNEICFKSRLILWGLWFLGIQHQTIDKNCPWQNGRVERFFGTLKSTIELLSHEIMPSDIPYLLYSFEFWYNRIRFHQNLNHQTPESVYLRQLRKKPDG